MLFRIKPLALAIKLAAGVTYLVANVANVALAAPVVPTPGSVSTYTYFPPASQTGGSGSGSGTGEDVSTLQRCLWAPSSGDQTVSVASQFNYTKPITLYYKLVGGNGGAGPMGGGGGSSAILLNGAVAAVGKGGDGGGVATEVAGTLSIKAGDTLRFVTGGGGGDAQYRTGFAIGGGGGAGYMGGGGGGSLPSRSYTAADYPGIAGKGGGTTGGAGGTATGGQAGTAGSSLQGGVSTYPNGSAAPTGTYSASSYSVYFSYYDFMGVMVGASGTKYPATGAARGAPVGDPTSSTNFAWAGGGGKLGGGGSIATFAANQWCQGSRANFAYQDDWDSVDDASGCPGAYNTWRYLHAQTSKYPAHGVDMRLTRQYPAPSNSGYQPIETTGGSLPGQIITMYQAPVCGFLP